MTMPSKLPLVLAALCLTALTFGLRPVQAAPVDAGACAQLQSQAAPDSIAQIFQDLQPAKSATEKSFSCPTYCAQHPCGHAGWVCGEHFNSVGLLVCGCYDPSQGSGQ
jgi:hypothetical protein